MKLLSVPGATKWNSWFNAAKYHSSFTKLNERLFKQGKSYGLAVDKILELVDGSRLHHASYHNLCLNLDFIKKNCTHLIKVLTSLEETKSLLVCVVYNKMEDIKQYLHIGTTKSTFGIEIDHLLSELENIGESYLKFPRFVRDIFFKLNKCLDTHSMYNFYKASCLFDPRWPPCISQDIDSFVVIKDLQEPSTDLL